MARVYRNRALVYLAIISFFYFSCIGCIVPFLTSHMELLGFSLTEISFINAISAFVSILGPILGGIIAEKTRCHKCVFVISLFIGATAFIALTFVPKSERLPYKPRVDFSCQSGLRIERCANWRSCREGLPSENATTVRLTECRYQCEEHISSSHPLHICFHGESGNTCVVFDAESGNFSMAEFETQLSKWIFDEKHEENIQNGTSAERIKLGGSIDVFNPILQEGDENAKEESLRTAVEMCNFHPNGKITLHQRVYKSISCRPSFLDCNVHCKAAFKVGEHVVLPKECDQATGNPKVTFWSYLVLRCVADMCFMTVVCILDALIVSNTFDFEGAYGRMHVWAAIGLAAFSPFSGALIDHFTDMEGKPDYSPPMFVSAGVAILTCALAIIILPKPHPLSVRQDNFPKMDYGPCTPKTRRTMAFELFFFVIMVITLGTQWGVMHTFLPLLTTEVGCSGMVTGLGYTLIFGCCLPFLLISKNLVRNIGRANLVVFAFLFYGTRYAGISFVYSAKWTLPFSAMGSFTLCVMWIAVVAYGQSLVPNSYNIVMQYVLNVLHFGIGRGIGSYVGGILISLYGQRVMFRGVAVFSAGVGILYLILYHLALRRRSTPVKGVYQTSMNGSPFPMSHQPNGNTKPNGNARGHHTILAQLDDDSDLLVQSASPMG